MLSTVLVQLQDSHLLKYLPVVDSNSVAFIKRGTSGIIEPISCELQSQCFLLEFVFIMVS